MSDQAPAGRWIVPVAVLFEGGLAALAWGLAWLLDLPVEEQLRWDWEAAGLGAAACVPMLALFWACLHVPLPGLERIRGLSRDMIRPLFAPCSLGELAVISALAGLGEEMLFRGVLQAVLGDWLGTWSGLLLAAAAFGLAHAITPTYAVLAGLMGAYLGALWLLTGGLVAPAVAHGVYDFVALVYLTRARHI
jgi:membrane protease YdiL (CAAX protease family)